LIAGEEDLVSSGPLTDSQPMVLSSSPCWRNEFCT
jgi:hypothetical protein